MTEQGAAPCGGAAWQHHTVLLCSRTGRAPRVVAAPHQLAAETVKCNQKDLCLFQMGN